MLGSSLASPVSVVFVFLNYHLAETSRHYDTVAAVLSQGGGKSSPDMHTAQHPSRIRFRLQPEGWAAVAVAVAGRRYVAGRSQTPEHVRCQGFSTRHYAIMSRACEEDTNPILGPCCRRRRVRAGDLRTWQGFYPCGRRKYASGGMHAFT